jgi:hypothetical protein
MKALVVYESMYGNTAAVGEAIASALRDQGLDVDVGPVSEIEPMRADGVQLLVVGGPTHVHGMSSSKSRQSAASDEKNTFTEPTIEPGLRGWLKDLAPGAGRLAAAFDTRIDKPVILTGSAAKGIGHRLKGRGFRLVAKPESFFVSTENRLVEGELDHAGSWAGDVAQETRPAAAAR